METTDKIRTKGRGVNGKQLYKYILKDKFLPYYKAWLIERNRIMAENNQEHDSIFICRDGSPAGTERLRDWINSWSDIVNQPLYAHCLRHYQISLMKRLEIDDDLIVYLTGWAEGTGHTMISIYNDNELKDTKFACLDNFKKFLEQ